MIKDVEQVVEKIKFMLEESVDLASKNFLLKNKKVGLIYFKSLTNPELVSQIIFSPLLVLNTVETTEEITIEYIKNQVMKTADLEVVEHKKDFENQTIKLLLQGKIAIFMQGEKDILIVDCEQVVGRSPEEPPTSAVIYGPREGFTENVKQSLSMLRKRLPTEKFVVKDIKIGRYTETKVFVTYIKGIANPRLVKEIMTKLGKIEIDGVVDSHYVLSYLQKESGSFLKQAGVVEKPDIVTAKLLEGRVAILVDNSPIVLTVPFLFFEDMQNANDYYTNPIYVSFIRVVRMLSVLVASVIPGAYLALRLYHYKVLPLRFLITIANATEGLPFTPFIELLFILGLFQILYEVSLRLPRYLGLATSIVGALILGDTGVNAGLISPPGVIIIAMSIISIYAVPDQAPQLTILRFIFLILGGTVGILGIIAFMIYVINECVKGEKYGVPYLAPYAPRIKSDLKDGLFMKSIPNMQTRPKSLNNNNLTRAVYKTKQTKTGVEE